MSDPVWQRGDVIRFSKEVEVPAESGWRVVLFRVERNGLLAPCAEVEVADASSARLWAISEVRRRGRGVRAVVFRPDGVRAFSEGD
jgi:hypothetical protein